MIIKELGDVIASRRFTVRDTEPQREIEVLVGRPRQFTDSMDFFTPYQIRGIGSEEIRYAGGIDAVQSIQLSMGMIGADLKAYNELLHGDMRWEGDENGDLGFPF